MRRQHRKASRIRLIAQTQHERQHGVVVDHLLRAPFAFSINPYHLDDADGAYSNAGRDLPVGGHWSFFAQALRAATTYE
ncbi:hypothetical protein SAMN05428945_2394 [Streptomyces sp. 2224.1]|nr:hypothetical protein SAMN05428945_2394 [Streptomyces sp. 2224.1]